MEMVPIEGTARIHAHMAIKRNVLGIREIDCSEGLNTEEYNQVDPNILNCFPRRQYPVDLFQWKEKIRVLSPVYRRSREVGRDQRKQSVN